MEALLTPNAESYPYNFSYQIPSVHAPVAFKNTLDYVMPGPPLNASFSHLRQRSSPLDDNQILQIVQELQPSATCSHEALSGSAKDTLTANRSLDIVSVPLPEPLPPTSLENPLDLHMYTVAGALVRTKLFLCTQEALRPVGTRLTLTIITGWGRHSKGPARIRPAIIEFLNNSGYLWEEDSKNPGRVNVCLQDQC